jgi:hypothetical protein
LLSAAAVVVGAGGEVPSNLHQVLVELLTETNALADLLRVTRGVRVGPLRINNADVSRSKPVERRGDGFFLVGHPSRPRGWLFLEVQTAPSLTKVANLPVSFEMARARHRGIEGDVVLVCVGEAVGRFFDKHPFRVEGPLGTQRTLRVVRIDLSPRHAKRLLDARHPYLSVLAVAAARDGRSALNVAERALQIARRERRSANTLTDGILLAANDSVRQELERKMERQGFRSPFLRKLVTKATRAARATGRAEGEAKGKRIAVGTLRAGLKRVVESRSIELSATQRGRIDRETDLAQLQRWFNNALTASTAADVFGDA